METLLIGILAHATMIDYYVRSDSIFSLSRFVGQTVLARTEWLQITRAMQGRETTRIYVDYSG